MYKVNVCACFWSNINFFRAPILALSCNKQNYLSVNFRSLSRDRDKGREREKPKDKDKNREQESELDKDKVRRKEQHDKDGPEEHHRSTPNKGGILVLPTQQHEPPPSMSSHPLPSIPIQDQDQGFLVRGYSGHGGQRQLFDPNNPTKPIIVSTGSRTPVPQAR